MERLALVSDTHVPSRAAEVPAWVREEMAAADRVVHAGDFDSPEAYEAIRDLAPDLATVRGNMDPVDLGLDEVATLSVEGVKFVVVHGTGSIEGYEDRVLGVVRDRADGPTVGVSGHTHEVHDLDRGDVRLLNPGSATGAAPAERETMMVAEVDDGEVDVTLLEGD